MNEKQPHKLVTRRSSAGLGLFAGENIPRGKRIIEYTGEMISSEEADRRGGKYLFSVSSKRTVDGKTRDNIARYINHSCKPNCETEVVRGKIYVLAKRVIKIDEELCYDYGKEYFDEHIKPKGCRCEKCCQT